MAWDAEQAFAELAAAAWCRQAAEQGHSISQYNLGLMYDNGEGVAEDNAEAVRWFRLATDQGHDEARDRLAMLGDGDRIDLFSGEVPEDDNEAIAWFQERANAVEHEGKVERRPILGWCAVRRGEPHQDIDRPGVAEQDHRLVDLDGRIDCLGVGVGHRRHEQDCG